MYKSQHSKSTLHETNETEDIAQNGNQPILQDNNENSTSVHDNHNLEFVPKKPRIDFENKETTYSFSFQFE